MNKLLKLPQRFRSLTTFLFINILIVTGQQARADENKNESELWHTNFEEAQQQAKQQNKMILMYFSGSDWCIPCMQLKKEVLKQDSFKSLAEKHFVPVALDFPAHSENLLSEDQQKYNEEKAEIYNKDGSFPLILILDSDGSELGKIKGYSREGSVKYLSKLKSILDKQ
jgi:thioredoxin-related protein